MHNVRCHRTNVTHFEHTEAQRREEVPTVPREAEVNSGRASLSEAAQGRNSSPTCGADDDTTLLRQQKRIDSYPPLSLYKPQCGERSPTGSCS
jgi:hypothetical protein